MKWRPISELSDEQRDGRWWLFARQAADIVVGEENLYIRTAMYLPDHFKWLGWDGEERDVQAFFSHFSSESVAALPKPQKMEWRTFDDEMPSDCSYILLAIKRASGYEVLSGILNEDTFFCRGVAIKISPSLVWMPIVPPEGE